MLKRLGHKIDQIRFRENPIRAGCSRKHIHGHHAGSIHQLIARIGRRRQDGTVPFGVGILRNHGPRHLVSGKVAFGRPPVFFTLGKNRHHSETLAAEQRMKPSDNRGHKRRGLLLHRVPVEQHGQLVRTVNVADRLLRAVPQIRKSEVREVNGHVVLDAAAPHSVVSVAVILPNHLQGQTAPFRMVLDDFGRGVPQVIVIQNQIDIPAVLKHFLPKQRECETLQPVAGEIDGTQPLHPVPGSRHKSARQPVVAQIDGLQLQQVVQIAFDFVSNLVLVGKLPFQPIPTQIQMAQMGQLPDLLRDRPREIVPREPQGRHMPLVIRLHAVPRAQRLVAAPVLAAGPAATPGRFVERIERRPLGVGIHPGRLHHGQLVRQLRIRVLEHDDARARLLGRVPRNTERMGLLFQLSGAGCGKLVDPLPALADFDLVNDVGAHLDGKRLFPIVDFFAVATQQDDVFPELGNVDPLFERRSADNERDGTAGVGFVGPHAHRHRNVFACVPRRRGDPEPIVRGSSVRPGRPVGFAPVAGVVPIPGSVPAAGIVPVVRRRLGGDAPRLVGGENQLRAPARGIERRKLALQGQVGLVGRRQRHIDLALAACEQCGGGRPNGQNTGKRGTYHSNKF